MKTYRVTCYTVGRELLAYDTAETLRLATTAERRESDAAGDVGAFTARVTQRAVNRCPMLLERLCRRAAEDL